MNHKKPQIFKTKLLLVVACIAFTSFFVTPPKTVSAADCSDVYTGLSPFVVDGVNANRGFYIQVANATGVPWEALAAIHYRETNFSHSNPSNGQGIFQFVNKEGGPYPTGAVSDGEFVRQLTFMANRLQNDYVMRNAPNPASLTPRKLTTNEQDTTLIKNLFYSYNGRATVYANQASQYGFNPASQPYEGSPYVMNRFDCSRSRMGIITQDYGSLNGQDTRYGAFTIYARLKGDAYWLEQQKPYLFQPITQEVYEDAAMTRLVPRYNNIYSVKPGQKAYVKATVRNTGNTTWQKANTLLGTVNPKDRVSAFANSDWVAGWRAARINEASVAPGSIGTFTFSITGPQAEQYTETFKVVVDGVTWIENAMFTFTISAPAPLPAHSFSSNRTLNPGETLQRGQSIFSADKHSILKLRQDGNLELWTNYRKTWESNTAGSGATYLINQPTDGNLVLYAGTRPVWASNTFYPGLTSKLDLQSDGNLVLYTNSAPSWSTQTVTYDQYGLINSDLTTDQVLFPGQSLFSSSAFYELRLQDDGNLVIYTPNRAIWSSLTFGQSVDRLILQPDGNMVIYDTSNRPLWSSRTNGLSGGKLTLQSDGNVVFYNLVGPVWASNTRLMQ